MSYHDKNMTENTYKVMDGKNDFWGILSNADISKCTLYRHDFAVMCKSRCSKSILLSRDSNGLFDFAIWGNVCHNKAVELCIEEEANNRLGETPLGIKLFGISPPKTIDENFISYYEIHYSEKFMRNVILRDTLTVLEIVEFQNLCAYFPEDVSPLLRETSQSVYKLFSGQA